MKFSIPDRVRLQGPDTQFLPTQGKDSGAYAAGLPDMIVIHYTAGKDLASAVKTLQDPSVKASAHLVVGRDGAVRQLIPFDRIAWHAGVSEYQGRSNLNRCSLGIEIDNAGRLEKSGDRYKAWFGQFYPESEVFIGTHRNESRETPWHAYTMDQIDTVFEICRALVQVFGIKHIVGHEEIAPKRKTDPGPAFPLDDLRRLLFEDRGAAEETAPVPAPGGMAVRQGKVLPANLNFRGSPAPNGELLGPPLSGGTTLDILEERDGWYKVKVQRVGRVKKEFVGAG
jgi:N-acetylmuramoyl-L-alanine amidase